MPKATKPKFSKAWTTEFGKRIEYWSHTYVYQGLLCHCNHKHKTREAAEYCAGIRLRVPRNPEDWRRRSTCTRAFYALVPKFVGLTADEVVARCTSWRRRPRNVGDMTSIAIKACFSPYMGVDEPLGAEDIARILGFSGYSHSHLVAKEDWSCPVDVRGCSDG